MAGSPSSRRARSSRSKRRRRREDLGRDMGRAVHEDRIAGLSHVPSVWPLARLSQDGTGRNYAATVFSLRLRRTCLAERSSGIGRSRHARSHTRRGTPGRSASRRGTCRTLSWSVAMGSASCRFRTTRPPTSRTGSISVSTIGRKSTSAAEAPCPPDGSRSAGKIRWAPRIPGRRWSTTACPGTAPGGSRI